jgi:archaellin
MNIDIKRGYEILPDNNIIFGIRITNNSGRDISDVQVILDYNESIFELHGDRIQKPGDIRPTIARTVKFTLKPKACVHRENIEASIIYRDPSGEKHMAAMQAKDVHCICPFLHPKTITKKDFLQLSGTWNTVDLGINFEGIDVEQVISFLMQTSARNLYAVDGYAIKEGNVLHLSSESADGKTHYLLTALVKENAGLIQVMLRAASENKTGLHGFLSEIVSELRHLIDKVDSAKEIGVIKSELVSSIIDTIVPGSNLSAGNSGSSVNRQSSVVRKSSSKDKKEDEQNCQKPEDVDVARMYDSYLKEVKGKPKMERSENIDSDVSYPEELFTSERKIRSDYAVASIIKGKRSRISKPKKSKKDIMKQFLVIAILMLSAAYLLQNFGIGNIIGEKHVTSESEAAENVVIIMFNAVNAGDFTTAFKLCEGQAFLVPASVQMIFNNNGIEAGGIKEFNIITTTVEDDIMMIESNCTAVTFNIMGNENDPEIIDVYFQLQKSGSSWVITGIAFDQPYEIVSDETTAVEENTGKQATQEVSSNLMVKTIEGVRAKNSANDMSSTIDLLKLKVGLNVGSKPVDMSNVVISIRDRSTTNILTYAGTDSSFGISSDASVNLRKLVTDSANPQMYYTVEKIRDEDESFSQSNPVMNTGDLITVYIVSTSQSSTSYSNIGTMDNANLRSSGLNILPGTGVSIILTPESGAVTEASFSSPTAYGVKETVQLYP